MVGNISISGVSKHFINSTGERITALDNVSLEIPSGSFVSLIGPSGCGKSTLLRLISGLIPMDDGSLTLDGTPIKAPGADRGFMFQEHTLFPWLSIYDNIAFGLRARGIYKQEKDRVDEFIEMVGLKGFEHSYPHQLSGGMRQRVMIAMALACRPKILIADEPTTALDVTIQAQILRLMNDLQAEKGTSIIFITHDLGVINEMADDVAVMYCGQVVEKASARVIFTDCKMSHPYTEGLMFSIPRLDNITHKLEPIPGVVPHPLALPKGCKFAPRCKYCTEKCIQEEPGLIDVGDGQLIRCFYPNKEERCSEEHKKITVNN